MGDRVLQDQIAGYLGGGSQKEKDAAFEKVCTVVKRIVESLVRRLWYGSQEDGQDIGSEVLLAWVQRADEFLKKIGTDEDAGRRVYGWVAATLRYKIIDWLRRNTVITLALVEGSANDENDDRDHAQVSADTVSDPGTEDSEGDVIKRISIEEVLEAAETLPVVERKALMLHLTGYKQREIAEKLEIPRETARNHVRKALETIIKKLRSN